MGGGGGVGGAGVRVDFLEGGRGGIGGSVGGVRVYVNDELKFL